MKFYEMVGNNLGTNRPIHDHILVVNRIWIRIVEFLKEIYHCAVVNCNRGLGNSPKMRRLADIRILNKLKDSLVEFCAMLKLTIGPALDAHVYRVVYKHC